jgi:hypothetical protein
LAEFKKKKIIGYQISIKPYSGSQVVPWERKDRQPDMTKLIAAVCNFWKAPMMVRNEQRRLPTAHLLLLSLCSHQTNLITKSLQQPLRLSWLRRLILCIF